MAVLTMLFSSIVTLYVLPPLIYVRGYVQLPLQSQLLPVHFVLQALNFKGMNYLKKKFLRRRPFCVGASTRGGPLLKPYILC
jgi:hypothetical protein